MKTQLLLVFLGVSLLSTGCGSGEQLSESSITEDPAVDESEVTPVQAPPIPMPYISAKQTRPRRLGKAARPSTAEEGSSSSSTRSGPGSHSGSDRYSGTSARSRR